jgi:translation initiation factor eIF-2B subunit alpha
MNPCVPLQGIQFEVVITEGRPDETGLTMAQALSDMRVPVIAILDCAVAYALEAFRCSLLPKLSFHTRH